MSTDGLDWLDALIEQDFRERYGDRSREELELAQEKLVAEAQNPPGDGCC